MNWKLICFNLIIFYATENVKCETSSRLPVWLHDCYRNNFTTISRPPLTVPILVEFIRKIELDTTYHYSLMRLTTAILHGAMFNGIEKHLDNHRPNVIPYSVTGEEFYKYKLLVDYLTSASTESFPNDVFSTPKFCFFHKLISSSIQKMKDDFRVISCMPKPTEFSDSPCKIHQGVIKTKWGPITVGQILAGIATGVQNEKVSFDRVHKEIFKNHNQTNEIPLSGTKDSYPNRPEGGQVDVNATWGGVDGLETTHLNETEIIHTASTNILNGAKSSAHWGRSSLSSEPSNINTVWVSTVAGDLAQVVLNQANTKPIIGEVGNWNDTLLPREYYLVSAFKELSDADVLGGIDGIALASFTQDWRKKRDNVRLSQIIDMFYSDRNTNVNDISPGNRDEMFHNFMQQVDLQEQVLGAIRLLRQYKDNSQVTLSEDDIKSITPEVIETYKKQADSLIKTYDITELLKIPKTSAMELIVILDGTYDSYNAQRFLYSISEAIDVSVYASKIGVINGQTADWISNITSEYFELFAGFYQTDLDDDWPITLSLSESLETIIEHYQRKSRNCSELHELKPLAQSILVFSHDGLLTASDIEGSQRAVASIKGLYPDTNIIYVTLDKNNHIENNLANKYDNDIVIKPNEDILALVADIVNKKLNSTPANIVKFYCSKDNSKVRFEDYITPGIPTYYQQKKDYLERHSYITKFSNTEYGELTICVSSSKSSSSDEQNCKNLTVNGEISFNSNDFCNSESTCDLNYVLTANPNSTNYKCAETDCRYPDQIRLNIYVGSNGYYNKMSISLLFIIILLWII